MVLLVPDRAQLAVERNRGSWELRLAKSLRPGADGVVYEFWGYRVTTGQVLSFDDGALWQEYWTVVDFKSTDILQQIYQRRSSSTESLKCNCRFLGMLMYKIKVQAAHGHGTDAIAKIVSSASPANIAPVSGTST